MKEAFITIVEKQRRKEIVPFLQSLTAAQKKELVPVIKELEKEYLTFQTVTRLGITSSFLKGNEKHRIILLLAAFVCFKRAEFEKLSFSGTILEAHIINEVIDWYCPDWFSDFINGLARGNLPFFTLDYAAVIDLTHRGFLFPSKELIVQRLPNYIYEHRGRKYVFVPEKLLNHPVILAEHIWYLFELESAVHLTGPWLNRQPDADQDAKHKGWIVVFTTFTASGKLDRQRVLRESLNASNRNFNKVASGWFMELFSEMEPSKEELLVLQQDLFAVLGSPHSKVVNTSLQCVKKIMTDKAFELDGFLDYAPVLLSSNAKNVVAAALMVFDKLAAKHADHRATICTTVLQVFIHTDDEVQARAAKIIVTNRAHVSESFKEELGMYAGTMLSSARNLLEGMMQTTDITAAHPVYDAPQALEERTALTPLPAIEHLDDLIFLMSQAIDNNQSWHIDWVPAAFITWMPQLQGAQVARLEPALQRALKRGQQGLAAAQGWLDQLLAVFVIEVCNLLVHTRGKDAAVLDKLMTVYRQEAHALIGFRQPTGVLPSLAAWKSPIGKTVYQPHTLLLLSALEKIRQGDTLPLMSTPTHEPGWIIPEVLVKRCFAYQQAGRWPDFLDLQVAFSRCYPVDIKQAIQQAEQQLQGEWLHLCLFLFGKHQEPQGPFHHADAWLAASLALPEKKQYEALASFGYRNDFRYYTGQFDWETIEEEFRNSRYDFAQGKNIAFQDKRKLLRIHLPAREAGGSCTGGFLKKVFSGFLSKPAAVVKSELLYDHFLLSENAVFGIENDIRRMLMLMPANPDPLLALVLKWCMDRPTFGGDMEKRTVIAVLQALHELWLHPTPTTYLFTGAAMLCSDKTAAGIAGEIWLQQVSSGNIDNVQLGKTIGLLLRNEFVPVKRFTDLVTQQLMRVSALHNQQLLTLAEHLLQELPAEPVKNTKKLLEIYLEVLDFNKARITNGLITDRLNAWKKTAALQKVTGQLLSYSV